jgi:hypothetical protein
MPSGSYSQEQSGEHFTNAGTVVGMGWNPVAISCGRAVVGVTVTGLE